MAASRTEALARQRATYQDVLDAPAHQVAEVVDGTLHTHPRPARPHARASSVLGGKIGGPFDYDAGGPGGWWIIDDARISTSAPSTIHPTCSTPTNPPSTQGTVLPALHPAATK